jgi:hypothetical protein
MRKVAIGLIGLAAALAGAATSALAQGMRDPAFLAEMEKANLEINPVAGQVVEALITRLFATPPAVVERAKQILPVEK